MIVAFLGNSSSGKSTLMYKIHNLEYVKDKKSEYYVWNNKHSKIYDYSGYLHEIRYFNKYTSIVFIFEGGNGKYSTFEWEELAKEKLLDAKIFFVNIKDDTLYFKKNEAIIKYDNAQEFILHLLQD